jgi:osmotically inducible lipoprotein OsmB
MSLFQWTYGSTALRAAALSLLVGLAACGSKPGERALSGGAIGAGAGAVGGALLGNPVAGAVVGGAVGAGTGALTSRDQIDLDRRRD